MRGSFAVNPHSASAVYGNSPPHRIKVFKRSENQNSVDDLQKSSNLGEMLQHEKSVAEDYRQRNERNIVKCRFLYNKLTALGNLEGVPEMIAAEVSQVDIKIKELEFQLQFKRSQQLRKLRKKVHKFLQQINFQIPEQDLEKIEDQIEIVLFLLDIFEEKFNEMTTERKQIDELIAKLQESSHMVQPQQTQTFRQQNQQLLCKIKQLENELYKVKNQDMRRLELQLTTRKQIGSIENNSDVRMAHQAQTLEKAHHKIVDLESQVKRLQERYSIQEGNLDRTRKEQARWKQRYRLMEAQKDQRIKMLERSLNQQQRH